jgi:hypothetical protein
MTPEQIQYVRDVREEIDRIWDTRPAWIWRQMKQRRERKDPPMIDTLAHFAAGSSVHVAAKCYLGLGYFREKERADEG